MARVMILTGEIKGVVVVGEICDCSTNTGNDNSVKRSNEST
jgi:hypothetical protein